MSAENRGVSKVNVGFQKTSTTDETKRVTCFECYREVESGQLDPRWGDWKIDARPFSVAITVEDGDLIGTCERHGCLLFVVAAKDADWGNGRGAGIGGER